MFRFIGNVLMLIGAAVVVGSVVEGYNSYSAAKEEALAAFEKAKTDAKASA
jgi:hypothetical protein